MPSMATDKPVAWCVNLSGTRLRCAKAAERIDALFGVETLGDLRHIRLNRGPDARTAGESETKSCLL